MAAFVGLVCSRKNIKYLFTCFTYVGGCRTIIIKSEILTIVFFERERMKFEIYV